MVEGYAPFLIIIDGHRKRGELVSSQGSLCEHGVGYFEGVRLGEGSHYNIFSTHSCKGAKDQLIYGRSQLMALGSNLFKLAH